MTKQASFSELEYAAKKKQTRRDRFLAEIEAVTPWAELERTITPFYPSSGGRGCPPIGLTRMLRMYVAQQCFGLSDEGVEDALYDSQAIRRFVGIDLAREAAPDATTLLKFRRLLETHQLTESIFNTINAHLAEKGLLLREGTIVDATLIAAPPSTKNREGKRDAEMHQTKKGNQWYFGMKAHIGVDAQSGFVHTVVGTAANVSDVTQAHPWTNGQVERMNRTIKDATVKRYHYQSHDQLKSHLQTFLMAYNFARRLKTLKGLTPYEFICKAWTNSPERFTINPIQHTVGLNIAPCGAAVSCQMTVYTKILTPSPSS